MAAITLICLPAPRALVYDNRGLIRAVPPGGTAQTVECVLHGASRATA